METIFFENSKKEKICGILEGSSDTVIILCHGFTRNKNTSTNRGLVELLSAADITTFRFDFYGHGESDGEFEDITVSEAVDDILCAIAFLKKKGFTKIGFEGTSFGGIAGLMAASQTNDLFALALKSPVSNYEEVELGRKGADYVQEWKEKGFIMHENGAGELLRLNYTFFDDFKNNNGYEAAKNITIPVFIVHGDADDIVPVEQSKKTASLISDCFLEIISGGDHKFSNLDQKKKVLKMLADFLIEKSC